MYLFFRHVRKKMALQLETFWQLLMLCHRSNAAVSRVWRGPKNDGVIYVFTTNGPKVSRLLQSRKDHWLVSHTVHSRSVYWLRSARTSLAVSPLLTVPNDVSGLWFVIPIAQFGPEAVEIRVLCFRRSQVVTRLPPETDS